MKLWKQLCQFRTVDPSDTRVSRVVVSKVVPEERAARHDYPGDFGGNQMTYFLFENRRDHGGSYNKAKCIVGPWQRARVASSHFAAGQDFMYVLDPAGL